MPGPVQGTLYISFNSQSTQQSLYTYLPFLNMRKLWLGFKRLQKLPNTMQLSGTVVNSCLGQSGCNIPSIIPLVEPKGILNISYNYYSYV